jgi:hypothetical protein
VGIVDFSFDIHPVAYAVAHILNTNDFEYDERRIFIKTYPFYNCRERSICISVYGLGVSKEISRFNIIFGEYRNSDNIVVLTVTKDYFGLNPLTTSEMEESDWNYKHFRYNELYEASDHIKLEIKKAIAYFSN